MEGFQCLGTARSKPDSSGRMELALADWDLAPGNTQHLFEDVCYVMEGVASEWTFPTPEDQTFQI